MLADRGAAHGADDQRSIWFVSEPCADCAYVGVVGGVEGVDVTDGREMLGHPVAYEWEARAESVGNDVVVVADVERAVAHSWVPGDLLDHLGVVVAGQAALA